MIRRWQFRCSWHPPFMSSARAMMPPIRGSIPAAANCTGFLGVWMKTCGWLAILLSLLSANASAEPNARQLQLLANNCLQCHSNPATGSPQMGRFEDWTAVRLQDPAVTLNHVVLGIRGMPPLGYCSACNEEDLRVLVGLVAGLPSHVSRADDSSSGTAP